MMDAFMGLGLTFCFGMFCGGVAAFIYLGIRTHTDVEYIEHVLEKWDARCAQCGRPPFIVTKKPDDASGPPSTVG